MIYLVDDSKAMRDRLVTLLSEIDGAVVIGQAENSIEALDGIRRLRPRVVILDIQMTGGSGIDVLKSIKHEEGPQPVVIMLTNHSYTQYRERCMKLGADFFLDKARDANRLLAIIKDLAESSAQHGSASTR
jgi:two-component system chemotaxis response regulator CheY